MVVPMAGMPEWRRSRAYQDGAAHPHSLSPQFYEKMEQIYAITGAGYIIRLKLVDGADARRCGRDTVDTRVRFHKCIYTRDDSKTGSTCECNASYGFLVDKSIERGDDKAAAVWGRYYIAHIVALAAMVTAPALGSLSLGCFFLASQECYYDPGPTAGSCGIPRRHFNVIAAVLFTASYGFPFVAFFVWKHLTNVDWCFDAATGDMHAAPCGSNVGPYFMLYASAVNFVPMVLLLVFVLAVKCVERLRVKGQCHAAGAAAPVSVPAPVVSHGPPAAVVGNVSNPQDGGDLANV
ncbi:unnamed protein product [Vitrella brassicaformis CCMP3155]|uniref:Uncharacterized protein n=1 Tax=Vitrella brassicaformis (strain CCMP3155) TaxID=1169540 RepID=A0A0G4H5B4_VITBC|nr:unnamed protein product [Vitrella brassicaformis CCMP3155]|eukprot:CEM38907.1 unnamed protein product [Vitrella brassicaformis CCMP3155]